jgi:hypothetical protein
VKRFTGPALEPGFSISKSEKTMARKAETAAAAAETPVVRTVTVEFLKSYRPAEPPADDAAAADPCWKYEAGAVAELPYAEARRAVALEIAKVLLDGDAL